MQKIALSACALALCAFVALPLVPQSASAAPPASAMSGHDTLDLNEVKAAAGAHFGKLDKDADGTLDSAELKGIIGPQTFKAADSDNDGTLSKDEYLMLVEKLFEKADVDNDGTLSVAELKSRSARTLQHLID